MARLFVCDTSGRITLDIDAAGPVLREALEHEQAEPVVRCAVLMALSALAEGDQWPSVILEDMLAFMARMKDAMHGAQMM